MQVLGKPRDQLVALACAHLALLLDLNYIAPNEPVSPNHRGVHRVGNVLARGMDDVDHPGE